MIERNEQKYILRTDGDNVIDIAQFFKSGNECNVGCYIFLGVWILLFVICLLYQYEVCGSKGRIVGFSNIDDEEGVSDAPNDEVQDNLLRDV